MTLAELPEELRRFLHGDANVQIEDHDPFYFVVLCRTALGFAARTQDGQNTCQKDMLFGRQVILELPGASWPRSQIQEACASTARWWNVLRMMSLSLFNDKSTAWYVIVSLW